MNTPLVIEKIDAAIAGLKLARAEFAPTEAPNVNLASFMASAVAGSSINLPPDYVHSGELNITKPMTIKGGKIIGPVNVTAPDVHLEELTIQGMNKDHTLLTLGDRTLVYDCKLTGHALGQHRAIRADSDGAVIRKVITRNIFGVVDTQAIASWDGCKNLLVEDCDLQASGEVIIFGGSDPLIEANIPQNIIVRRSKLSRDIAWKGKEGITNKNLFELKNVKNILVQKCDMEYSWNNGQIGFGIVITVRNQYGKATWSTIENAAFEDINVSKCAGGISILGHDYFFESKVLKGLSFKRINFTEINPTLYGLNGRCIQMSNGGEDISFDDFSFSGTDLNSFLTIGAGSPTFKNLQFRNGKVDSGEYGMKGDGAPTLGVAALDMYAPGYTWSNMSVRKGNATQPVKWPVGTIFV